MNVVNPSANPQARYPRLLGVVPMPEVVVRCVTTVFSVWLMCWSLQRAYWIRTFALKEYGHVIHEFDPWFNYRAVAVPAAERVGGVLPVVRLRVLVPPWAPCGDDNLPGAANHSGGGALGAGGAGAAVRGHNELGLLPPALLGRGAGVVCDGADRVGNERKIHRGSGHGGGHGHCARAPDALRGGRVRQRVHCDIRNGADIFTRGCDHFAARSRGRLGCLQGSATGTWWQHGAGLYLCSIWSHCTLH